MARGDDDGRLARVEVRDDTPQRRGWVPQQRLQTGHVDDEVRVGRAGKEDVRRHPGPVRARSASQAHAEERSCSHPVEHGQLGFGRLRKAADQDHRTSPEDSAERSLDVGTKRHGPPPLQVDAASGTSLVGRCSALVSSCLLPADPGTP